MKLIFVKTFFGKRLCYSSVLILKVALFLGVQSCSKLNFSHVENIASTQTYLPPEENEGPGIERSEVVQSSVLQFFQPPDQITKQVDILFVVDTSGSLDDERNSIGKNIAEFIEALPSDTDYVISVLLAHGSKSS
ncbi:MAG: hypothetical protein KDD35_02135 [Bdellovibrionales bacterium]|nr:hypothetical protein [Bdellovibrionales bacterium]